MVDMRRILKTGRILTDGLQIQIHSRGKQKLIQVLDNAGEILFTRCKSVQKTSVPILKDAPPPRKSIGFVSQKLCSHVNDRTRKQIGFLPEGVKPEVYKTAIERKTIRTVSKTDFDRDFNVLDFDAVSRITLPNQGTKIRRIGLQQNAFDGFDSFNKKQSDLLTSIEETQNIVPNIRANINKTNILLKEQKEEIITTTNSRLAECNELLADYEQRAKVINAFRDVTMDLDLIMALKVMENPKRWESVLSEIAQASSSSTNKLDQAHCTLNSLIQELKGMINTINSNKSSQLAEISRAEQTVIAKEKLLPEMEAQCAKKISMLQREIMQIQKEITHEITNNNLKKYS